MQVEHESERRLPALLWLCRLDPARLAETETLPSEPREEARPLDEAGRWTALSLAACLNLFAIASSDVGFFLFPGWGRSQGESLAVVAVGTAGSFSFSEEAAPADGFRLYVQVFRSSSATPLRAFSCAR